MSRTCWSNNHVNQALAPPDEAVLRCTCGRSPDFNVHLPSFMDFSPTELPTTGSITTGSTTSEIPSPTSSAMPTTMPTRNATTLGYTSIGLSSRTMTPVTRHEQEAGENSASTLTDNRLLLVIGSSSLGACILLPILALFIFIIFKNRKKKPANRDIDVIPVTHEEGSTQGTPIPGELKRPGGGNNNPTLTESQDRGIDGATNSSSTNGVATNTVVTLKDPNLKGDPV